MLIFLCLSAYRSIYFGHILILLHAFATLISFLQENKFSLVTLAGHLSTSLSLQFQTPRSDISMNLPRKIEGGGGCIFPLYVKNGAQSPFKKEIERFKQRESKKKNDQMRTRKRGRRYLSVLLLGNCGHHRLLFDI